MVYNSETKNFELLHDNNEDPGDESRTGSNTPGTKRGSQSDDSMSFVCSNCGTINNNIHGSNQRRQSHDSADRYNFKYQDLNPRYYNSSEELGDITSSNNINLKSFKQLLDRGFANGGYSVTSSGDLLSHDYFKLLASTLPVEHSTLKLLQNDDIHDVDADIPTNLINQGYFDRFFKVITKLGSGSFGQVYKVEHELLGLNLGVFALKKIPIGNDRNNLIKILNEVKFLYNLSYLSDSKNGVPSHVIKYNHVWIELSRMNDFGPEIPIVFLLFEYCDGGTLEEWVDSVVNPKFDLSKEKLLRRLRRHSIKAIGGDGDGEKENDNVIPRTSKMLTNYEIFKIFKDITLGLKYLHDLKIIHRDLKPSNCLFKTKFKSNTHITSLSTISNIPTLLVSDFGESITLDHKRQREIDRSGATGTIEYCAPELLSINEFTGKLNDFDYSSDIYSLGMILYYLCFGKLPYKTDNLVKEEILNGELFNELRNQQTNLELMQDWIPLIESMVDLNSFMRPNVDEILVKLESITNKLEKLSSMTPVPVSLQQPREEIIESDEESGVDLVDDSLNVNHKDQLLSELTQYTGFDSFIIIIGILTILNLLMLNELQYSINWVHAQFLILGVSLGTSKRSYKYWLTIIQIISLIIISILYFIIL